MLDEVKLNEFPTRWPNEGLLGQKSSIGKMAEMERETRSIEASAPHRNPPPPVASLRSAAEEEAEITCRMTSHSCHLRPARPFTLRSGPPRHIPLLLLAEVAVCCTLHRKPPVYHLHFLCLRCQTPVRRPQSSHPPSSTTSSREGDVGIQYLNTDLLGKGEGDDDEYVERNESSAPTSSTS